MRAPLLPALLEELFQSERWAYRTAIHEAARLPDARRAAVALRAITAHANETLDELVALARARGFHLGAPTAVFGDALALLRRSIGDRVFDAERSYREVLLGLRRGVDLARLIRSVADAESDAELASFCERWLPVRERLVAGAIGELVWFGRHLDVAARRHAPRFA